MVSASDLGGLVNLDAGLRSVEVTLEVALGWPHLLMSLCNTAVDEPVMAPVKPPGSGRFRRSLDRIATFCTRIVYRNVWNHLGNEKVGPPQTEQKEMDFATAASPERRPAEPDCLGCRNNSMNNWRRVNRRLNFPARATCAKHQSA
jgi:hypothetical protein